MKIGKKLRAGAKLLALLASAFLLFGAIGCSHGGGGSDPDENEPEEEKVNTSALYRLGAKSDCDFADGKLTAFDGDGTQVNYNDNTLKTYMMYYPAKLDLENGTASFQSKINFSSLDGMLGVGVISIKAGKVDGYAFVTAAQKVRYGKSSSLGFTKNGQGFDSTTLTDSKVAENTDYIFKASLTGKNIVFEVLDATDGATVLATKSSKYSTYFGDSDDVYFAIGAPQSTSTQYATWSSLKATIGDTSYNITAIENVPDQSTLELSAKKLELNKGATDTSITYIAKDKNGDAATVEAISDKESIATVSASDGTITINGVAAGSTTIKITNLSNTALSETITVAVLDFNSEDPAYSGLSVYPASGATAAFEDGEFMLAGFDSKPTLATGGSVKFYEVGENNAITLADSVEFADETQYMWALSDASKIVKLPVKNQLVRVTDNAVYVTPHNGKIAYGKKYLVAISNGAITGSIGGVAFEGLTNNAANSKWIFTTRAKPTVSTAITVNNSQTATDKTFRSVQSALLAIGSNSGTYTVTIEPGTYYEPLYFDGTATVILHGDSTKDYSKGAEADVIISHANASLFTSAEKTRNVLTIVSGNFVLENLSIVNTFDRAVWGKSDGQAECIGMSGGKGQTLAAYNCSFISHQDTIRTVGKAWFYKCYVEGDTDYLWQESDGVVMLMEDCALKNVYDENAGSATAYIVAPRMTIADSIGKGLVVLNSAITTEAGETAYFGRSPWSSGYYNQSAFIGNTITSGSGTFKTEWSSAATSETVALNDGANVGWKFYNNTLDGTAISAVTNATAMTEATVAAEYNGRRAILNRLYNVKTKAYAYDNTNKWDIDEVITAGKARGWTVADDASSETAEGEEVESGIIFDFSAVDASVSATKSGITYTPTSVKKETNSDGTLKPHAQCQNGSKIVLSGLTGNAYVTVTYYYQAKGSIVSGSQTAVEFALAEGDEAYKSTSKFASTKYTHQSGTKDVIITTSATTYITKIKVEYDDEIEDFKVAATGVSVTPTSASVVIGDTTKITAKVTPDDSTDTVTWTTTAGTGSVDITPNADGTVTVKGKTAGTATVTAKVGSQEASATITVSASAVKAETVTLADKTVWVGQTGVTLAATLTPAGATDKPRYTVASGDDVISVDKDTGALTILKAGTATVSVTAGDATTTTPATITVKPNAIGQTYAMMTLGQNATTSHTGTWSQNNDFTDGVSDDGAYSWKNLKYHGTSYGTVTQSSTVLRISVAGAAKITWYAYNDNANVTVYADTSDTASMAVDATTPTGTAFIDKQNATLKADGTQGFLYTGTAPAVLVMTFSGSCYMNNLEVAALSASDEAKVTEVALALKSGSASSISVNGTTELEAKVYRNYLNADATVTFESNATSTATVKKGTATKNVTPATVTGVAAGSANITATAGGVTSSAVAITVTSASVNAFAETDVGTKAFVQKTNGDESFTITTTGEGGTIEYSSSNEEVATVDSSTGAVTIKDAGYTKISASIGGASKSYVLAVAPKAEETYEWKNAEIVDYVYGGTATAVQYSNNTAASATYNGLYVLADASGAKFQANTGNVQVNAPVKVYIPVSSDTTVQGKTSITVTLYNGQSTAIKINDATDEASPDVANGYVYTITGSSAKSYTIDGSEGTYVLITVSVSGYLANGAFIKRTVTN